MNARKKLAVFKQLHPAEKTLLVDLFFTKWSDGWRRPFITTPHAKLVKWSLVEEGRHKDHLESIEGGLQLAKVIRITETGRAFVQHFGLDVEYTLRQG